MRWHSMRGEKLLRFVPVIFGGYGIVDHFSLFWTSTSRENQVMGTTLRTSVVTALSTTIERLLEAIHYNPNYIFVLVKVIPLLMTPMTPQHRSPTMLVNDRQYDDYAVFIPSVHLTPFTLQRPWETKMQDEWQSWQFAN